MTDYEGDEIQSIALEQGWMDQKEINMTNVFINDIQSLGFDKAIKSYENQVLDLPLDSEEFANKNLYVNALKSLNHYHPEIFKTNVASRSSIWKCLLAIVSVTASAVGLVSCATIILCGLAIAGYLIAIANFLEHCTAAVK